MKRADWLNLIQAALVGLQSFNLYLVMNGNINPMITAGSTSFLAAGTMFIHLMGINTPAPGQIAQSAPKSDEPKTGGAK